MDDRQLISDLLSALEYHTEQTRPIEFSKVAIEAAREYLRKPAQPSKPLTRDELRHMYQNSTAWQFYCDIDARLFGRPAHGKGDA